MLVRMLLWVAAVSALFVGVLVAAALSRDITQSVLDWLREEDPDR